VVVINHGLAEQALALRDAFARHVSALAIDSGSRLDAAQAARFTVALPNVYYSGLVNAAVAACADLADDGVLLVIASDVTVPDPGLAIRYLGEAFSHPRTGVWGPSATGGTFPDLANHGSGGLRAVAFVEGFCLAARLGLFRAFTPVDRGVNPFGWGLDLHVAYLARMRRRSVWIDDRVVVHHAAARAQRERWATTLDHGASHAHAVLLRPWLHSRRGAWLLRFLPPGLGPALFRLR
jgi:hypothetical protein